jgi:hypothetical protein
MRKEVLRRAALRAFVLSEGFCSKPDFVRRTAEASSHRFFLQDGKAES